jgi:hypothetical protein
MITMPAFFGDPSRQAASLELLRVLNKAGVSGILSSEAVNLDASELGALHEMSGFPASLLTVIDQIMNALPLDEAHKFGVAAIGGAKPGANVADIGWRLVEAALTRGVARGGEEFLDAARKKPMVFPRLVVPTYTASQLKAACNRSNRIFRKLGQDRILIEDPRVVALMSASTRGGEANAGAVVKWVIDHSYDPDSAAQNFANILIELIEAA